MTKIKFHIHVVSIYLEKSREKGSYLIVHFRMTKLLSNISILTLLIGLEKSNRIPYRCVASDKNHTNT